MQALVITDEAWDAAAVVPAARVVSMYPPRVHVLEPPTSVSAADLLALPGVRAVLVGGRALQTFGDASVLTTLSAGERLFVQGWGAGQTAEPKARPGEGLPWDAPGFEPPDDPAAR